MSSFNVYRDLMDVNCASRKIRSTRKILLYGKCVRDEYPEIFDSFSNNRTALAVCPEKTHFNMICLKIASILARVKLEELVVLTVDGSPHCIQLHHIVEEARKITKSENTIFKHFVIEGGKIIEVGEKEIKVARYLSKIKKFRG